MDELKKSEPSMKTVTLDQVMSWHPCRDYTRDRIAGLFAGREGLSAIDILGLDIPAKDRVWSVLHKELMTLAQMRQFATACAERAIRKVKTVYKDPAWNAWADAWLSGADRSSKAALAAAAWAEVAVRAVAVL